MATGSQCTQSLLELDRIADNRASAYRLAHGISCRSFDYRFVNKSLVSAFSRLAPCPCQDLERRRRCLHHSNRDRQNLSLQANPDVHLHPDHMSRRCLPVRCLPGHVPWPLGGRRQLPLSCIRAPMKLHLVDAPEPKYTWLRELAQDEWSS